MNETQEFLLKFILAVVLSLGIYYGVEAFGHWIAWWAAFLIGFFVIFGGWLILTGDWFD